MRKLTGLLILEGAIFGGSRGAEIMWPELSVLTWFVFSGVMTVLAGVVLYGKELVDWWRSPQPVRGLQSWATAIPTPMVIIAIFALGLYAVVGANKPDPMAWTHPQLSTSEQRKISAECTMAALERAPHPMHVRTHKDACLISKGFVQSTVVVSQGNPGQANGGGP